MAIGMAGCVLAPRATREERLRAAQAGTAWERPAAHRTIPPLGPAPDWPELLRHALLANGALEAAYHEWRAALARIDVEAAYPNTNLSLGYEHLFSSQNLKTWDRTTLTLGIDPMQNLSFPTKALASGRVALADAQAAGDRFRETKLALQQEVLTAWYDFALAAEQLRLEREAAALAGLAGEVALARITAGDDQQGVLASLAEQARAADGVQSREADLSAVRARLNALVGRPADAPLPPPATLPEPRPLASDDVVLAAGVRNSPQLAALGHDETARREAVGRARQEWIPDVNPFVGLEGSMAQVAGLMASLPARITMIRGQIAEARTMEARAAALRRQGERDRAAEFLETLAMLRAAERRTSLYEDRLVPLATQLTTSARAAYEGGRLELPMLIEAERGALDARGMLAEARMERERRLAALEALGGFDAETLDAAPGDPS
jgi:outer membrane protein TolC